VFRLPLLLCALAIAVASSSHPSGSTPPSAPRNGEELIALMHDRYAGKWVR
jgi:hypothetical protein